MTIIVLQFGYLEQVLHTFNHAHNGRVYFVGSSAIEFIQAEGLNGALLTLGAVNGAAHELYLNLCHVS